MKKKFYILLTLILLIAFIFGAITFMWFRYISNAFEPFINIMDESIFSRSEFQSSTLRHTHPLLTYREEIIPLSLETFHTIEIFRPFFLDFGGYISVSTVIPVNFESGVFINAYTDYSLNLTYRPRRGELVLGLVEVEARMGNLFTDDIGARVNRYGYLHKDCRLPYDDLTKWLCRHERFYESIMSLFAFMREIFGDEVFDGVR
ncbi:MAG: hypothetical protein FWC16_00335 [Defluviitaleaceae bacterium]|nr:hypothetical protein [Defluviitaleaceae bacterium]MCL2273350.1 hypothetical protein [Defluviitaleaceae bacterium]